MVTHPAEWTGPPHETDNLVYIIIYLNRCHIYFEQEDIHSIYIVRIHFSETSTETMEDKIKRMLKNEVRQMMENE